MGNCTDAFFVCKGITHLQRFVSPSLRSPISASAFSVVFSLQEGTTCTGLAIVRVVAPLGAGGKVGRRQRAKAKSTGVESRKSKVESQKLNVQWLQNTVPL
jgi:hypothetical protein